MSSEWREVQIDQIADIFDNLRKPVKKADRKKGDFPYYGASGIADYVDSYLFNGEYILISEDGENLKTRNTPIVFLANGKFWVNNHAHIIKANEQNDTKFLCYALQIADIDRYISGSTRPKLTQTDMKKILIKCPPLSQQKRIAKILGDLDDKIELNRKMNETLEGMAQALFKSWFVDFDPVIDNALAAGNDIPEEFADRAQTRRALKATGEYPQLPENIRHLFPSTFTHTDQLGWIPESWENKSISQLISINPKTLLKKSTIAKFLEMKSIPNSGFSVSNIIQKEFKGGVKFTQGDVLLAKITPCLENGKTAIVDFLNNDEAGFGSTELIVLRGNDIIKTPFIACLSRFNDFRNHCIKSMIGTSGRQRVQNSCFENFFLPIPSNEVISEFQNTTNNYFSKISSNSLEIESLQSLRDILLPELLSGKVDSTINNV